MPQIMQEQQIVDPHNIDDIAEAKIENRYLPTPPMDKLYKVFWLRTKF